MFKRLIDWCIAHYKATTFVMVAVTAALALLAALPSLWPESFPRLNGVKVDTDPENMLPATEHVRVFNHEMKQEFALYDMLVVGVVNDRAPDYVFNPATLSDIYELTEYAKTLRGEAIGEPGDPQAGVIGIDIIAPSTVDNVEQGGLGEVSFSWLMPEPPETAEAARAVRDKAMKLPFMKGTLVSEDGQSIAIYLPLSDKHLSFKVAAKLRAKIAEFSSGDTYHITGLPIAEDTFGVEMFKQMAISAPMAMAIIFLLLLLFFKKIVLILSPMIVAIVSCVFTMALLVATGNTIHIMSSMIPIFIMPIAVLDSIHILSEFFDRYQESRDRATTIRGVMKTLFTPMLYTSLTTAVGFLSLALTPIPPVQVFGIYIATGVMVTWLLTVTFIPASVMFIREKSLENFGLTEHNADEESHSFMTRTLRAVGVGTRRYAKAILAGALILVGLAVWGITRVVINDNPVKWFNEKHPIRVADRVMNSHFGGTYMGYLSLSPSDELPGPGKLASEVEVALQARQAELASDAMTGVDEVFGLLLAKARELDASAESREAFFAQWQDYAAEQMDAAQDEMFDAWESASLFVGEQAQAGQVFKDPAVLNWMAGLQDHLLTIKSPDGRPIVGKSNSLADLVRTVHRELMEGNPEYYRIPDRREGVAQTVLQYESSHRPQDLAHFVRTDTWRRTSMWIQQKSGDNHLHQRRLAVQDGQRHDGVVPRQFRGSLVHDDNPVPLRALGHTLDDPADTHDRADLRHDRLHRQGLRHACGSPFLAESRHGRGLCHPLHFAVARHGGEARLVGGGRRADLRRTGPRNHAQRDSHRHWLPAALGCSARAVPDGWHVHRGDIAHRRRGDALPPARYDHRSFPLALPRPGPPGAMQMRNGLLRSRGSHSDDRA